MGLLGQAAATHFASKPLPDSPAALAYIAAIVAQVPISEKQALLSIPRRFVMLQVERAMLATSHAGENANLSPN